MIRIPPRATSLNRTWKPRKSAPTTKNIPNGFFGYSTSGRKDGSSLKDRATSVWCQCRFYNGLCRGHTGRLVEVALEDVLVEDQQSLQNLESMLVRGFLPDLEVQVFVRQGLFRLQSLERQGWSQMGGLIGSGVYSVSKRFLVVVCQLGTHSESWQS